MYNIIPLILILFSLIIIMVVISRKFSILANVDIENIPAEREAKVKEQIISNRFKRNFSKWTVKIVKFAKFTGGKISELSKWAFEKLLDIKDNYKKQAVIDSDDKEKEIENILNVAEEHVKEELYDEAEKDLIKVIELDSMNYKAFTMLGDLYIDKNNYEEARETYSHLLKILPEEQDSDLAEIYYNLSNINKELEEFDKALKNIKEALELNPNNPRYLDMMLEISIINKDKVAALEAFERLEKVNSDNTKLEEFEQRIKNL